MANVKKEKIKKNIYLTISVISGFVFIAGLMCTIMGEDSPVKFIINGSPIKLIVPPLLIFVISFKLYMKSKKNIKEN